MTVIPIKKHECTDWLLNKHYAKRLCPISYAFGAYVDNKLIGIVTYGVPSSSRLREGICGKDMAMMVLELNRLCCLNEKNVASELVGKSLNMLPKPSIVVSYADTQQGHVGYVYQATNFIYTGLSAKRTDWKVKGLEHKHSATIADMSRGYKNRAQFMRDKFQGDFYLEDRPRKHRYVFFVGKKTDKFKMLNNLKYPIEVYPKGDSRKYDVGGDLKTQSMLFT